jgi:hypothetical protein
MTSRSRHRTVPYAYTVTRDFHVHSTSTNLFLSCNYSEIVRIDALAKPVLDRSPCDHRVSCVCRCGHLKTKRSQHKYMEPGTAKGGLTLRSFTTSQTALTGKNHDFSGLRKSQLMSEYALMDLHMELGIWNCGTETRIAENTPIWDP